MSTFVQILKKIKNEYRFLKLKSKYEKNNRNNFTYLNSGNCIDNITVGNGTYGPININDYNDGSKLFIGNYCSIAKNVNFILGGNHSHERLFTYPFKFFTSRQKDSFSKGDIIIEDDVWIGFGAIILSGVKIGKGAVIAAGSVVCRDVLPFTVVGGVPAKLIKNRFEEKTILSLINCDYSKMSFDIYENNISFFEKKFEENDVNKLLEIFNNQKNNNH